MFPYTSAILILIAAGPACGQSADGEQMVPNSAADDWGKAVYERSCAPCHGIAGSGEGLEAWLLGIRSRDLTGGLYKYRSTPSGDLPSDQDLYRTVARGIFGTSMPHHNTMREEDRWAVVRYVKSFYPDWQVREAPLEIPKPPRGLRSPASVERGKELYGLLQCGVCHGENGKGDGPAFSTLASDAWGNDQTPFDLTRTSKRGPSPEEVHRTVMTGLNGTAMATYGAVFEEPDGIHIQKGDAWRLVAYLLSIREPAPRGTRSTAPPSGAAPP